MADWAEAETFTGGSLGAEGLGAADADQDASPLLLVRFRD